MNTGVKLLLASLFLLILFLKGWLLLPPFPTLLLVLLGMTGLFFLLAFFESHWDRWKGPRLVSHLTGGKGRLLALFMGSTMVGGAPMLLPLARSLRDHGVSMAILVLFVGSAGAMRLSMLAFEVTFLGFFHMALRLSINLTCLFVLHHWMERGRRKTHDSK